MLNKHFLRALLICSLLFLFASVSFAQTTKSYIEKMSGWETCSVCAGAGGNGPTTPHSMTQNVSSPTMGAKSAHYWIGPKTSFGDALWWKQLGPNANAHNFQYDIYYYLKNPSASQALEFDVNQSVGGKKFIFGTQCELIKHQYQVWSSVTHWMSTGIPCATPQAYKWNHLTLQFQRTSTGKVFFVSVTINGVKHYINRTYSPQSSGVAELNVAFQMDGNRYSTSYDAWLENVTLKYW